MKFNPITSEVFTDEDKFLKKLFCPYNVDWDELEKTSNSTFRKCTNCDHLIVDTSFLTDDELLSMIKQNPKTCLKIDLNQHNLKIVSNV